MNWPISGSIKSERLSVPPILVLNVDVTGIAITRVADAFTVLVVTTDEGELLKVRPLELPFALSHPIVKPFLRHQYFTYSKYISLMHG